TYKSINENLYFCRLIVKKNMIYIVKPIHDSYLLSFLQRNEGQLVGTSGGILIALLATYLSYRYSRYQASKKEKTRYQGMLYTLHVELYWQNLHFDLLIKTLESLKIVSIQNKSFVLEDAPMQFDLFIIEKGLANIIEYKNYKHELVALLVSHLNQIRSINQFLDFKNVSALNNNLQVKKCVEKSIESYFDTLSNEYINKTQPGISVIRKMIEDELKDYPEDKLIFAERSKTL
ncbi:MAG: hypothetical protein WCR72_16895, partial [Bacteroidota bacterium]